MCGVIGSQIRIKGRSRSSGIAAAPPDLVDGKNAHSHQPCFPSARGLCYRGERVMTLCFDLIRPQRALVSSVGPLIYETYSEGSIITHQPFGGLIARISNSGLGNTNHLLKLRSIMQNIEL
jgi:hypothetical protein